MASPETTRLLQAVAAVLGTVAVVGTLFEMPPVELGILATGVGVFWVLRLERLDGHIPDRTAHLLTGVLAVTPLAYFLWAGDADNTVAGFLLTVALLSLGRAAWVQWSIGDAFDESTHPFTPPAWSDNPVAGEVRTTLADGPRTRRELCEVVDAEADAVDDALVDLRDRGVVAQAGSEFRLEI